MQFKGEELLSLLRQKNLHPPSLKVDKTNRFMVEDAFYTAIVYEFVEKGPNNEDDVQKVLDLLWCAGFCNTPVSKAENWASGVLLDHSDIIHCGGNGWDERLFGYKLAKDILREPGSLQLD
jgi:hypothetical protein